MALPPTLAPPPGPAGAAPDDAGMAGMAPDAGAPDDTGGADDEANEPQVFATILRTPDGKFVLVAGDEPDPDEMGTDEPSAMDRAGVSMPAILKQLMEMDKGNGAEESFGKAFRGEPDTQPPPAGMMK